MNNRMAQPRGLRQAPARPTAGFALLTFLASALFGGPLSRGQDPAAPEQAPTLSDAEEAYLSGRYDEAREALSALASTPALKVPATILLARCDMQTGDYEDGIARLEALKAGDSVNWHVLLGRLYRRVGRYEDALAHARRAVRLDGDNASARWLLGSTLEYLGRRQEAIEAYRWFDRQVTERDALPEDAVWITDTARGFLRYSVLTRTNIASRTKHALNRMLQVAYTQVDRSYWPARIATADLLREKYNNSKEDGSVSDYQAALRVNPNLPQSYTGLGEAALTKWDFESVERYVEKALAINPRYAEALHLLGKKLIVERRYEKAVETADRALAINRHDLAALSIRAAALACRYDREGVAALEDRVRAINPRCALLYRTLGDALGGIRQYAASEKAYQKAIEFDPTDANARAELGMMYMQWGDEEKARVALEAAWDLDPFNERTHFTLELLDQIAHFARVETPHFIVKYDAQADPGLGEYAAAYLEDIYERVTEDYETPLREKTIIELFPTHRAFGVRITGKPWIHTVGASTGRVIALASPRETNQYGRYNMARVLLHEFTHTVTLAATNNRIPHWFTEGLAVLQEDAPRPMLWWRLLAEAARRNRLFTLESIDWGFIRPQQPGDRQMAYAQSEWMCEYLISRFGYDILGTMLADYRQGRTQEEVFEQRLGLTPAAFDEAFASWAKSQLRENGFDLTPVEDVETLIEAVHDDPENAALFARLARAVYDRGDKDRAVKLARRALEKDSREPTALTVAVTVLHERAEA
ncbi:MAG: tetratricopeptide repeat protein, partial [Planctomycetota bacterium]